jgi:serine/threonine protein kinase
MTEYGGWEIIEQLGEGGQSTVFKVRNPSRVQERKDVIQEILRSNPWEHPYARLDAALAHEPTERIDRLAKSLWEYVRPDDPSELGALKRYKIPSTEPEASRAIGRLKNEIDVLRQNQPGLVKLLEANEEDKWIVTEFMPGSTLGKHPDTFKGNAHSALKAYRSVVETAARLHEDKIVHRDIKPANVFIGKDGQLVLGDLGIVFLPNQAERLTGMNERVGPRDYMPVWGNLGVQLENVQPNFDVYMLGKLLWCMIDGRSVLPREWHTKPDFNLEVTFPNKRNMFFTNSILDKCLVDQPDLCLSSAKELLDVVDETLAVFERPLPMLDQGGRLSSPCRMCGKGTYESRIDNEWARIETFDQYDRLIGSISARVLVCNVCKHFELFEPGYPDRVVKSGWKP